MANLTQPFKCMCTILFFLFILSSYTVSTHSSTQEIEPQNPSLTTLAHYHQVFYLKNTDPMFFKPRQNQRVIKKRRINRNKNMKHRKKMVKNMQSRTFSAMLPKGFVPPSGSSPCHNDQPNSMAFHCHLTTEEP
ncbi:uncharacterized protein LOC113852138 [Abrus precatorius]|uniref:Uncharacterized protein LOC113852138 n=1 Tax=Abrus precatorius TaxID=3816 RepID=A0A8B8K338_ABRPR|nr:uncharacterized protein LOC113852138 [Abrus precatorius]